MVIEIMSFFTAQQNPESFIKTWAISAEHYLGFAYTEKQMQDIEKFCTTELEASVLAIYTKFFLCDKWITK